ncbi:hypothetical protein HC891_25435 [Candidatus Gracilibacteria bacterium]|nr:hypothetical protein [Candidatus Gracilibacteria bacterium]
MAGAIQGSASTFALRLQANCGPPDPSFGKGGLVVIDKSIEIAELLVLPAGQIQLVGMAETGGVFLARLAPDGSFDDSFGSGGRLSTPLTGGAPNAATLLADDKLLVAATRFVDGAHETLLRRYTNRGVLDSSFGEQGVIAVNLGADVIPAALVLRDDASFALVGCHEYALLSSVTLFTADGSLDPAFGTGGTAPLILGERTCIHDAVFSDSRLFVGGFAEHGAAQSFALAAYDTGAQRSLSFAPAQASVPEATAAATLTVQLSQTAAQTVTVRYEATGGSATNGQDYTLASGTLAFAPGERVQHITVALANDSADEPDETLIILLSDPSNAILGGNARFTLTITDDDGANQPTQYRVSIPLVQQ